MLALAYFGILVLVVLLVQKPKFLTYLVILTCMVQTDWFVRYMSMPEFVRRIPIAFSMVLISRLILEALNREKETSKTNKYIISMLVLLSIHLLMSVVLNNSNPVLAFYSNRYIITGYTIYIAYKSYIYDDRAIDNTLKMIVIFAMLQIPVSLLQYFLAAGGQSNTLDTVTGTFTSYSDLVGFQTIAIGVLIVERQSGRAILQANSYFLATLCLIPMLISNSKTAVLFPMFMIGYLILKPARNRRLLSTIGQKLLMAVMMIITVMLFYKYFWINRYDIDRYSDREYITNYYTREAGETTERMGRLRSIIVAKELITEDTGSLLVGKSPGATQIATLLKMSGQYYEEVGRLAGLGRTQISVIITEYGITGIVLLVYMMYKFKRMAEVHQETILGDKMKNIYGTIIFVATIMSWYALTLSTYTYSALIGVAVALLDENSRGGA